MKNIYGEEYDINIDIKIPEEKEFEDILEKINNLSNVNKLLFKSNIIKNDIKKQNLINDWIKEKLRKNSIKYELIYKMSVNGSNSEDFHKCCDDKGATLTIIETENNFIFGGFTALNWKYNGRINNYMRRYEDEKKYDKNKINTKRIAIISRKDLGPAFGNYDVSLGKDLKNVMFRALVDSNFFELDNLELIKGRGQYDSFIVKEVEIFNIL